MSLSEVQCLNHLNFSTMMSSLPTTRSMMSSPPAITAITSSVSAARANIGKTQTVFSMQTFGMSARKLLEVIIKLRRRLRSVLTLTEEEVLHIILTVTEEEVLHILLILTEVPGECRGASVTEDTLECQQTPGEILNTTNHLLVCGEILSPKTVTSIKEGKHQEWSWCLSG